MRSDESISAGLICCAVLSLGLVFTAGIYLLQATQVASDEFSPKAMLAKYTWFKDAAAQLEQRRANITIYENRVLTMDAQYQGTPRNQWPRTDLEQYNLWLSEVAGATASYNALAAEYNANMSKFHWRFANQGELPPGATSPLPREFKPYLGK